jgi:CRP/FNR family cyclic AMP-dependent transcriptional regulator
VQADAVIHRLRAVDLFRDLDDATLALVAAAAQERRYEAGQTLFLRGDDADSMFIVSSGSVRLSLSSADGHDLTLRHVGQGAVFGEVALLDGGVRTTDATALRPSVLYAIPRGRFQSIVYGSADTAKAVIKGLCRRLRDTTDQLEAIALLPLDQRLARLLIQLAKAAGASSRYVTLALEISQGEIATLVAASRPKVNQLLVAWAAAGVAARTPHGLLLDTAKLAEIIDAEDA